MYDFYFGEKDQIISEPEKFIIFCKRLLPRWLNGIPDSECIALYRILVDNKKEDMTIIETGCGASTIAFVLFSILHNAKIYSWDLNGSKGSILRSIINESICDVMGVNINNIWKFINADSTNMHIGIQILNELKIKADFCFFDSWHTSDHLFKEINSFEKVTTDKFVIALDDAFLRDKSQSMPHINIIRRKLNLEPLLGNKNNISDFYYKEISKYLESKYKEVKQINDTYKQDYKTDIFFDYYEYDRITMNKVGLEKSEHLEHRFDAWIIGK